MGGREKPKPQRPAWCAQHPQNPAQSTEYSASSELYRIHPSPSKPHLQVIQNTHLNAIWRLALPVIWKVLCMDTSSKTKGRGFQWGWVDCLAGQRQCCCSTDKPIKYIGEGSLSGAPNTKNTWDRCRDMDPLADSTMRKDGLTTESPRGRERQSVTALAGAPSSCTYNSPRQELIPERGAFLQAEQDPT